LTKAPQRIWLTRFDWRYRDEALVTRGRAQTRRSPRTAVGLPADESSPNAARSARNAVAALPAALDQAKALRTIGDGPPILVTAASKFAQQIVGATTPRRSARNPASLNPVLSWLAAIRSRWPLFRRKRRSYLIGALRHRDG